MTPSEFEDLLTKADLHPRSANVGNVIAFSISHHSPIEIPRLDGTVVRSYRHQCDMVVMSADGLDKATLQSAKSQMEAIKRKLERAAKTKQGVVK